MKDTFEKSLIMVSMLAIAAASSANASLVAHWKFDETSGTTAHDSSGNGCDAAVIIGRPLWDSRGRYGGCLNFDGTYGLLLPPQTFANIKEAISVCMWVNSHRYQPDDVTYLFKTKGIAEIEMRWKDDRVAIRTGRRSKDSQSWKDAKLKHQTGRWNHYVFVTDTTKSFQGIYLNGQLVAKGSAKGQMGGMEKVYIGANDSASLRELVRARIDDVRIYNHGLAADEVSQLYESGPPLRKFAEAAFEGEAFLNEHSSEETIVFLDKKTAEVERWGLENPAKVNTSFKETLFDLNFLLARAKQDAGRPQKEVEAAYERASKQGLPSAWFSSSVVLWLQANGKTTEYLRIVGSLGEESVGYLMNDVMAEAEGLILDEKKEAAVKFIETNLAAYALWQEKHPHSDVAAALGLPHIYFQLANARKAVGASKESIAEAYSKAFGPSNLSCAQERSVGLRWLLQNGFKDDLTEAIKSFAQEGPPNRALIDDVCRHLESEEDWAGFELFLDTLFTQAKNPAEWMMVVESSLSDKTNRWAKGYFSYIVGRPALKFSRDCAAAERYLADEEYERAARLYKDIVNRCSSTDDKALFEFQLCKSLFYADRPAEVIAMLESFTASYGATHSRMAADALLMKGRLYLQLREIDQALNAFRRVASEYPRTEQVPEAEFFVGYCYVLSNRRQEAAQALAKVAQDYPDSGWASKARLCLARTETMADAGIAE